MQQGYIKLLQQYIIHTNATDILENISEGLLFYKYIRCKTDMRPAEGASVQEERCTVLLQIKSKLKN